MRKVRIVVNIFLVSLILAGCATYYEKNFQVQSKITAGHFESANKLLDKDKKASTGNNRVLYYFNKGMVNFMLQNHSESNKYLEQADLYIEDYSKSFGAEALALVSNPMVKPYRPEDFESVMVHFYKALNYLFLNNFQEALVECRRVNIVLNQLNDKYKKGKNKYDIDAFAHNLMGIIYEASGDVNNAFIAYRNSYDAYESKYQTLFEVQVPEQLKRDLLRTAHLNGFYSELHNYEEKFGITFKPDNDKKDGELVFFWLNGFGPVKSEWSINFANGGNQNGFVMLVNEEMGLNYPIFIGNKSRREKSALGDLSILRVAFPKYVERKPEYSSANLQFNGRLHPIELAEDVNKIAFQCLKDRMLREVGNSIARLATKKALEEIARKENENLGALVSIVNAITEKTDTRNWQSLPYSISYARIKLPAGEQKVELNVSGKSTQKTDLIYQIISGKTTFGIHHDLSGEMIPSR